MMPIVTIVLLVMLMMMMMMMLVREAESQSGNTQEVCGWPGIGICRGDVAQNGGSFVQQDALMPINEKDGGATSTSQEAGNSWCSRM